MLMNHLGQGTEIVVVGENRSGIKSIEKFFKPYGVIKKYDSARRCSFYWGQCTSEPAPFELADWFKSYTLPIDGQDVVIKSLPGVFSHGEFDVGTQLLLKTLPELKGKVLDFGCGAGVIGATMAMQYPEIALTMCDVSALAVASSKATLEANGLKGNVIPTDVYSDIDAGFDFLISNPLSIQGWIPATARRKHCLPMRLTTSARMVNCILLPIAFSNTHQSLKKHLVSVFW